MRTPMSMRFPGEPEQFIFWIVSVRVPIPYEARNRVKYCHYCDWRIFHG